MMSTFQKSYPSKLLATIVEVARADRLLFLVTRTAFAFLMLSAAAGNTPKLTIYPGYGSDGHEMFFEIGAYWKDVVDFLKERL